MSLVDKYGAAWEGFCHSLESDRLSHAYMIVGSPRGIAQAFALDVLRALFGRDEANTGIRFRDLASTRSYPDVMWIEPQSKGRFIKVEEIRALNARIHQTSYSGGWKAGVIQYADRMNENAQNAFLKTLEEPPGKSVLLLLTDTPQSLLPTIFSRCQKIVLAREQIQLDETVQTRLRDFLRGGFSPDPLGTMQFANGLSSLLGEVRKSIEEEDVGGEDEDESTVKARQAARELEVRGEMMRFVLRWQRDILLASRNLDQDVLHNPGDAEAIRKQAATLDPVQALRRVEAIDEVMRLLGRNVRLETAFEYALNPYVLAKSAKSGAADVIQM
ncbi:MAG: hypothetical protein KJ626_04710 [Verrucomicrobia bacterium]|nr:hypothetical protein [Verrucomicrobiota bacterium]